MDERKIDRTDEEGLIDLSRLLREARSVLRRLYWLPLALAAVMALLICLHGWRSYQPMYASEATFTIQVVSGTGSDIAGGGYGYYDKATAERIAAEKGYTMVEDAGRGYRQVVPSPKPVDVIEKNTVRALISGGCVVITVGGGGIPVVRRDGKLYGTPAVIDKDFASAKLAELVQADALVILTAVDRVCINWGKPDQKSLAEMTVAEAERYCEEGHFAPGSMLPKVRAAVSFAKTGGQAIIASLAQAGAAVRGEAGTVVHL